MKKRMQKLFTVMLIISVMMSLMSVNVYAGEFYNCGYTSEHTHTDSACYDDQLTCTKHVHDDSCKGEDGNLSCGELGDLTCGKAEHAHADACYHTAHGKECYHVHTAECYHQHDEGCYEVTCGQDESTEKHIAHEESCKELTCTVSTETESCDMTSESLVCGTEISALTCEIEEHAHNAECYTPHEHTKANGCYERVLVCQMDSGHKHTSACLESPEIMIDKYADGLDANDMTNVTLNVGGEESDLPVDIIYILGSFLDTEDKVEANIMIQCLMDTFEEIIEQGTTVNFGIVPYSSTKEIVLPFVTLNELDDLETLPEKIAEGVVKAGNVYDAVNMENALTTAKQMFSESELADHPERQHLVMISSGHTYYFNSGNNNENIAVVPVNFDPPGNTETLNGLFISEKAWMQARNANPNSYPIPKLFESWDEYWAFIEECVIADRAAGDTIVYSPTTREKGDFLSWINDNWAYYNDTWRTYGPVDSKAPTEAIENAVVLTPGENPLVNPRAAHAVLYERAMYEAYEYITNNITGAGINFYPIYNQLRSDGTATNGNWCPSSYEIDWTDQYIGHSFMNMLAGGQAVQYSKTDNKAFFDPIKKSIVNSVADGSYVIDYIGYDEVKGDFNFIEDAAAMSLVKNGVEYVTTKLDTPNADVTRGGINYGTATSSYTFRAPDAQTETFTVDYFAGEADQEFFIWTFHETVSNLSPASLTYRLHLTDKADIKDETQVVDTNIKATLYPVDSDKVPGEPQLFPVPHVDYIITDNQPLDPQDPQDPVNPPYVPPYTPPTETPVNPEPQEPPLIEVEDPEVPLGNLEEPDVPLAETEVEIEEEEVPLTDVPKTADSTNIILWLVIAALSAMALLTIRLTEKKES